jgi:hypothetical protein
MCSRFDSSFVCKILAYTLSAQLDTCYKLHVTPLRWREAFRTCRGEGSHLAIINSVEEAQLLVSEMEKHPEKSLPGNFDKSIIHVGFNDIINPGVYITINGRTTYMGHGWILCNC